MSTKKVKYSKLPLSPTHQLSQANEKFPDHGDIEQVHSDNEPTSAPPTTLQQNAALSAEVVTVDNEDTDDNVPATVPRRLYCNCCEKIVLTSVDLQTTVWSCISGFFIFFFFGWLSICILPLIWSLLQVAVHRCPICDTVLLKRRRISLFKFKEKIFTLRVGTCALVFTKRYLIGLLSLAMLVFFALSFRWYLTATDFPDVMRNQHSNVTWTDFLSDCGYVDTHSVMNRVIKTTLDFPYDVKHLSLILLHSIKPYLGNPIRVEKIFVQKYAEKTVRWEGRVHHTQKGYFSKHFIYIDMMPPFYPRNDIRDIILLFGKQLIDDVAQVESGDQISFEASLLELGRRGRPHMGILWGLNVTAHNKDLPPLNKGPINTFTIIQDFVRPPLITL